MAMEVEPKKLKGKRDLMVPKSFQQVDFWCKWGFRLWTVPSFTMIGIGIRVGIRVLG